MFPWRLSVTIGALEVYYYFAGLVVGCTSRTAHSPGDDLLPFVRWGVKIKLHCSTFSNSKFQSSFEYNFITN